jgi:hypothetical protein
MKLLETVYILDGIVFIYIMIVLLVIFSHQNKAHVKVLPKEGFCTCRGAGYNNSAADLHQKNCYMNKIPKRIWNQSYAGCTTFDDPGKISYDYNILEKQDPDFAGV